MSGESNIEHIDGKRIKLEDNHEKLSSFDVNGRNSVVDCFKNKCMNFITKQLDDKSVRAYNTFTNTGKKSKTTKIINYDHFVVYSFNKYC